jgi:hypothetical protein
MPGRPDLGDTAEDELVDTTQKPPQAPSPIGIGEPQAEDIEEGLPQAGMYNIELCDILSPNIDSKVNIIPMIDTVTVYEDINKPYILCDIAIRDSYGFRETIPIIGEEFINLIAQTKGFEVADVDNPLDNIIKKSFRVYSVSPIANVSERLKLYVLHCISIEAIISEKKKISRGYSDMMIEDIVKNIYETFIVEPMNSFYSAYKMKTEPKRLIIEPTSDPHTICFPFKSPFDIMDDLAEKATTSNQPEEENTNTPNPHVDTAEEIAVADGALYMFYETLTHFKFESLETSFKRAPKRNFVAKIDSSVDPMDRKLGFGWPGIAFNNVEEYTIDSVFDVIDNMREGMYAAKLITHDIVRMRYEIIGYKYIEKKEDMVVEQMNPGDHSTDTGEMLPGADPAGKHLADHTLSLGDGSGKLCSYNHDCLIGDDGGEGARIKLMGTNFNHSFFLESNRKAVDGEGGAEPGIRETNLEWRTQKRDSQLQQLNNVKITLKLAGDSSLRVGDIIWWHMPSQVFIGESSNTEEDPFLSGKYIMTKINHVFTNERYYQEIQIRKDSLQNTPPSLDENVLSTYAEPGQAGETAARLRALNELSQTPDSLKSGINPGEINPEKQLAGRTEYGPGGTIQYKKTGAMNTTEGMDAFGYKESMKNVPSYEENLKLARAEWAKNNKG